MPYDPIHQAQLYRGVPVPGRTQGSRDCGPRSWQMGADARSDGALRIGVRRLRRRAGATGPVPTSMDDAQRALDGLKVPGRTPLRAWRKRSSEAIQEAVQRGHPVVLAIHYGRWNEVMAKDTGDPYFTGAHSVLVRRERRRPRAGVEWLLFDPLDDGRRAGIARGGRWVRRAKLMTAARALGAYYALVIGGARER